MPGNDNGEPLSIRRSVIVWLAGGVFGWVIAVVLIYGTIRATSYDNIAKNRQQEQSLPATATDEKALQDIAPAAGPEDREQFDPQHRNQQSQQ
jgi:hypothetical protein